MRAFNNQEILEIALWQSAIDAGCRSSDFLCPENVVVISRTDPAARKYLELPFSCQLISYGNNIVASVSEEYQSMVSNYISRFTAAHCFETPNFHVLNDVLTEKGQRLCHRRSIFCLICAALPRWIARIRSGCWGRRISRRCTQKHGAMPSVKSGRSLMSWGWARMTAIPWQVLRHAPPTAKRCGKSVWMSCRNTAGRGLPRR